MYIDETKKKQQKIEKITDPDLKEKEEKKFEKEIEKGKSYWEDIKQKLVSLIDERNEFVTNMRFYPREYASAITTFEVNIERVEEYIQKNPLKDEPSIKQNIEEEQDKVQIFTDLKKKVEEMLPKLQAYEKTLNSKDKEVNYMLKKQEMFLSLQKSDFKKTKELLRYFRGRIKK